MFKVKDKVKITNSQGTFIGEGIIVNINDFREPSQKYAVEVDFYHDFIFAGNEHLELIKGEI